MIGWHEYGLHLQEGMSDGVRVQQKLREHSSWEKTTPQYKQHTYNN